MWGISSLDDSLSASQEGLGSMELVRTLHVMSLSSNDQQAG